MEPLNNFLDKIKETRSLPSDNALAKLIGVSRATVSGWRHGARLPDAAACARIADLAGVRVIEVIGSVGEARETTAAGKAAWRRVAAAAALAAAALLPSPHAQAAGFGAEMANPAYYVALRKLRRYLSTTARNLLR